MASIRARSGAAPRRAVPADRKCRSGPQSADGRRIRYAVLGLGWIAQDAILPAFAHARAGSELVHHLTAGGRTRTTRYPERDQFAAEIIYFSECIRYGREPEPSGLEGLADVRIIQALERSARSGRAVPVGPLVKRSRPSIGQEIRRPPTRKPALVRAEAAK